MTDHISGLDDSSPEQTVKVEGNNATVLIVGATTDGTTKNQTTTRQTPNSATNAPATTSTGVSRRHAGASKAKDVSVDPVTGDVKLGPSIVRDILNRIDDKSGISIKSIDDSVNARAGILARISGFFHDSNNYLRGHETGFTGSLVDMGVTANTARLFTADGALTDHEAYESMAQMGNSTFTNVLPSADTQKKIKLLADDLQKREGVVLTDDTRRGLERFEEGMLKVLEGRMRNPDSSLTNLFQGALSNPSLGVKGFVDFAAESATVVASKPLVLGK